MICSSQVSNNYLAINQRPTILVGTCTENFVTINEKRATANILGYRVSIHATGGCIYRYLYPVDKHDDIMGNGMVDVSINIVILNMKVKIKEDDRPH